ncbi:UNVERIFIED_CONTAM: hypothetical protein Sindi_2145400, partial [Sesamum indicum]
MMAKFLVVDTPFAYNVILRRLGLNLFKAIVSIYHLKKKFPTRNGVGQVLCSQKEARRCYNLFLKKGNQEERKMIEERDVNLEDQKLSKMDRIEPTKEHKSIELVLEDPNKMTRIGSRMNALLESMIIEFLRENVDLFTWSPFDSKGINLEVIVHMLNVDPMARQGKQKRRSFDAERNRIIKGE